jgi:hypothetical protein
MSGTAPDPSQTSQLPEEFINDSVNLSKKVNAYLGSQGNPVVMNSFVKPPSYLTLGLITAAL